MPDPFDPPLTVAELQAALPSADVRRPLGAGGQGSVFLCGCAHSASVLKVYGPDSEVIRVDREVQKLSQIDHPNIVRLLGHGDIQVRALPCRYAVVEYVDGTDLTGLRPPLPEPEVHRLLVHVTRAIEVLWGARVVHRDLKPANILRAADGRFVVIDLGFAKHQDQTTVTQAGFTVGTRGYMSPEQALGRRGLTFRSDLFALGVVAYEMASGQHPFLRLQRLIGAMAPTNTRQCH